MCFKGGPTTPLTSAPSARGLGILAFPEALARLVLRHAATARKTAPLQKLKRSFGLRSVRGIVVAPWRWRRVFRSATDRQGPCSWAESAAPDAADLQDRPARFATAIVGSVGADSNADGACTQSTRSPTPPYNAPTTLPNPGRLFALPADEWGASKVWAQQDPAPSASSNRGSARQRSARRIL